MRGWPDRSGKRMRAVGASLVLGLVGCQERFPTVLDDAAFPTEAYTVQVTLPFHEFAKDVRVWGGYGRPYELPHGVVARSYEGELEARTLISWEAYPGVASVRDTTGTVRADTALVFVGGRVVAVLDTLDVRGVGGPVTLGLGALQQPWDLATVSWNLAVDSVGGRVPWGEPGAGPVVGLGTAEWDRTQGDSVVFALDSAAVALWADSLGQRRGIRLEAVTEGIRLHVNRVTLVLTTRPRSRPDTLLYLSVPARERTFVYHPFPEVPGGEIRVGGVPAWRSVLTLDLPEKVYPAAEVCSRIACPITLTPQALVSASLVLRTQPSRPGFTPTDTLRVDVREALEPSRMPKSPLGFSLLPFGGLSIPPARFQAPEGEDVLIPLGEYVEGLIRARSDTTMVVSKSVVFLSAFEPLSLFYGAFQGPGSPHPPRLRLILTVGRGVQLR